ncbi:hypothetical protein BDN67DRAFT_975257 [Paxillus ammoniavirescens]|nr:hypothetical protein BDN67DRAFT_975257 [Paxillus ammoniavirescens]
MEYFNRRTSKRDDHSSRPHHPSGHAPPGPNVCQQQQHHGQPGFLPQGPMGHGRGGSGSIPPPPSNPQRVPVVRCHRCGQSFESQTELDKHGYPCGAAAVVTGFLTPYSYPAQHQHQHPPHSQAPQGSGGYRQHQIQHQNQYSHPDQTGYHRR